MNAGRVLISGGAGFIGSHLCARLIRESCEVWCLDSLITGRRENVASLLSSPLFHLVEQDVTEPVRIDGPFDDVMHLASPASPKDYLRYPIETLQAAEVYQN